MTKTLLEVQIGLEETKVKYNKKTFKNRREAVQCVINHLQRMMDADAIYND